MVNKTIAEKLAEQAEQFKEQFNRPLSEKYAEELHMYNEGTLYIMDDDIESYIAELKSNAADTSRDNLFPDFIRTTVIGEKSAVASLREMLKAVFGEVEKDNGFESAGALMIGYDWYYHYDSGVVLMDKKIVYPVLTEPRYLTELDQSFYLKSYEGPNFKNVWPDCSELDEVNEEMCSTLMLYYQYHSRWLLHKAFAEMDEEGELDFLGNRPFLFYIFEHDCEVMTLFVKE